MRALFFLPLLTGCLLLSACETIRQENRKFLAKSNEPPTELRFNQPAPGFIRSPYAPNDGLVDVRGIAPGTSVICPYTGRVFTVPAYDNYPYHAQ